MSGESLELQANFESLQRAYANQKYEEVVERYPALIARWPDFYPFHVMHGMSLVILGAFEEAISSLERALAIHPSEKNALSGLALCFQEMGRIDEAVKYLKELYSLRPDAKTAGLMLTAALAKQEEDPSLFKLAFSWLQPKYFQRHPDHQVAASSYVDLTDWCASNGIEVKTLDPGGRIELPMRGTAPLEPYTTGPVQTVTIPNAMVVTGLDWPLSPTGVVLDYKDLTLAEEGTLRGTSGDFIPFGVSTARKRVYYPRSQEETYVDEDVLFLSASWAYHFGHWITDYLPRMVGRQAPDGSQRKIFTYMNLPQAHQDALNHFKVKEQDLILGYFGQVYRFRSLTVPVAINSMYPAPYTVKFMYRALSQNQKPLQPGQRGRRIFLERSQTTRGRHVANKEEFQAVLDEYGFEVIRRAETSVADQDAIFAEASIIMGAFGTDLLTFYQVPPGTDFIVLTFDNMDDVYHLEQVVPRYCAILDMPQYFIRCKLQQTNNKSLYYSDIVVDCDELRATLQKVIAQHESKGSP